MSRFSVVQQAPPIEVFALTKTFTEDKFPNKVSLGVGGKIFLVFFKFRNTRNYSIQLLCIKNMIFFIFINMCSFIHGSCLLLNHNNFSLYQHIKFHQILN